MDTVLLIVVIALIAGGAFWLIRQRTATRARELDDARFEARRWVERLGGQIYILEGSDPASKQALADASERHNAAAAQLEQLNSPAQARQVTETAYEGLYYVRAARTAMGLDPGPELPALPGQQRAGAVSEARNVEVEGKDYSASPEPSQRNRHYYPGGVVAGRPVPQGWYSEPWWRPALVAGAWGVGSALLFTLAVLRDVRGGVRGRVRRRRRLGRRPGRRPARGRRPGRGLRRRRLRAAAATTAAGTDGGDFGGGDFGGGDF